MKRRAGIAGALLGALVGCASVPALAQANVYPLSEPIVYRQGSGPSAVDFGYRGPRFFVVGYLATSVDTYLCPRGQYVSGWTVVTERPTVPTRVTRKGSA